MVYQTDERLLDPWMVNIKILYIGKKVVLRLTKLVKGRHQDPLDQWNVC